MDLGITISKKRAALAVLLGVASAALLFAQERQRRDQGQAPRGQGM